MVQPLVVFAAKAAALFSKAVKACLSHDWPTWSKRSLLLSSAAHPIEILRNVGVIGVEATQTN